MSKLRKRYQITTAEALRVNKPVSMSPEVRFIVSLLSAVCSFVMFQLAFSEWSWGDERYVGIVLAGLWAVVWLYSIITFVIIMQNPRHKLSWNEDKTETSATLAKPFTAEGKIAARNSKLILPDQNEISFKITIKNYNAILLVLLGIYNSVLIFQFASEEVSEEFLYIYPGFLLFFVFTIALMTGSEDHLKALWSLKYLLFMALLPSGINILYEITEDKWMAITMCAGSFTLPGILVLVNSMHTPRRKYTFPRALKERKEDDKV